MVRCTLRTMRTLLLLIAICIVCCSHSMYWLLGEQCHPMNTTTGSSWCGENGPLETALLKPQLEASQGISALTGTHFMHDKLAKPTEGAVGTKFSLSAHYSNPHILQHGCGLTVVIMEPEISTRALWTLESVASHVQPIEDVCILLQTSICGQVDGHVDQRNNRQRQQQYNSSWSSSAAIDGGKDDDLQQEYRRTAQRIENDALPRFRALIHQGQVRMAVLNHSFYGLESCNNFYNPSRVWQNWHYWNTIDEDTASSDREDDKDGSSGTEVLGEFRKQDSDLILMVQSDSVLCRTLDFRLWQTDVAWVGAPWPAFYRARKRRSEPMCEKFQEKWNHYHRNQNFEDSSGDATIPPYTATDLLCGDAAFGPQGNGGLSLRRRSWLRRAIEYCPSPDAHLPKHNSEHAQSNCSATNESDWEEDVYFVTVLKGLGAPLPSIIDAALFARELRPLAEIQKYYNISNELILERINARWAPQDVSLLLEGNSSLSLLQDAAELVPLGLHKPWSTKLRSSLCSPSLHDHCPHLRHLIMNSDVGRAALKEVAHTNGKTALQCLKNTKESAPL